MIDLDRDLVARIKMLKLRYKEVPQPELLIGLPNRDKGVDYWVETKTSEFTSLCPLNMSQPDYAEVLITYRPNEWTVELKSLKFYLASFRQVPIFHEQVPTTIAKALVDLLKPKNLQVVGTFTVRGGITTTVSVNYNEGTGYANS